MNELGLLVQKEWLRTPQIRAEVLLDEFVIMPNHLHGILIIQKSASPGNSPSRFVNKSDSLGTIIRGFKGASTSRINRMRDWPDGPVWQRNYYEHVIRDDEELGRIREYIINNPARWDEDLENPINNPK